MFAKPQQQKYLSQPPSLPFYSIKQGSKETELQISFFQDECNIGFVITGGYAGLILPSFKLLWHNPDCEPPTTPEPDPLSDEPYSFPPEPLDPTTRYILVRFNAYSNIFAEEGSANGDFDGQFPNGFTFSQNSTKTNEVTKLEEITDEIIIGKKLIFSPSTYVDIYATHVIEWGETSSSSSSYLPTNQNIRPGKKPATNNHAFKMRTYVNLFEPNIRKDEILSYESSRTLGTNYDDQPFGFKQHTQADINSLTTFSLSRQSYESLIAQPNINKVTTTISNTLSNIDNPAYNVGAYRQRVIKPRLFLKELPPGIMPPPPPEKKKMDCCEELRALLKLALKRIGSLPASVPDNFTKQNPSYIKIESLAELMLWQVQQLDAVMGSYPIEIEVEDTDIQEEGDQSKKVTVPNAAEAIAEVMGMLMSMRAELNANLVLSIKGMTEAGMAKKAATTAVQLGLANAEFLGYKLGQRKSKMPMLFSPNEDNLQKVMQEKEIEYIEYSNDDGKDFHDKIEPILTMAARWNAQNWRRVATDAASSLKEQFMTVPSALKERWEEDQKEDFSTFTENAEKGFTNKSGITNMDDPWGNPYGERPRIREIGTTGDVA